jgi:subtilisin family serine protease
MEALMPANDLKSLQHVGEGGEVVMMRRLMSVLCLALMVTPLLASAMPVKESATFVDEDGWWVETTVDRNKNGIGDMIEKYHDHPLFLDEDNTLPLIIDFDHLPTAEDIAMLEREVGYDHEWNLPLIHAVAGRVPHSLIIETTTLPGVVMLELDGLLGVQNGDSAVIHEVDLARQQTGYDGSGVTVAVIDTGIDSTHVGLNDLDDDDSTHDPKVIAFYDAVNAPDKTNGTEIQAYDDHGHGSHCAGTVAGTGAPTYEHPGMAPQAFLVGVKVLDAGGSGSFATVMGGMQWTVDHRYEFNIRAASMSLGGFGAIEWTSSEEDSVNRYANEMVRAGITMLIAAGNTAGPGTIGTPGSSEDSITVGALNKNTAIAEYSSEGPTEELRIKPNVAFVGSDVMSVQHNTGDGYVAFSGTSMATPGVAGTVALMLQANPDLSPFDVRNILQETATYRECHYMFANQPCPEDQIPKNRQNNVYGHGHVEALAAVMEAAERDYQLDTSASLFVDTSVGVDDRIHLMPGKSLDIEVNGYVDTVQWRSNHLRDDWANLHTFDHGDDRAELDLKTIVHQLEHLPGINVEGNHTLSIRGLMANESGGHSATSIVSINVMLMDTENAKSYGEEEGLFSGLSKWAVPATAFFLALLVVMGIIVINRAEEATTVEKVFSVDSDIEAVVDEAELDD